MYYITNYYKNIYLFQSIITLKSLAILGIKVHIHSTIIDRVFTGRAVSECCYSSFFIFSWILYNKNNKIYNEGVDIFWNRLLLAVDYFNLQLFFCNLSILKIERKNNKIWLPWVNKSCFWVVYRMRFTALWIVLIYYIKKNIINCLKRVYIYSRRVIPSTAFFYLQSKYKKIQTYWSDFFVIRWSRWLTTLAFF